MAWRNDGSLLYITAGTSIFRMMISTRGWILIQQKIHTQIGIFYLIF